MIEPQSTPTATGRASGVNKLVGKVVAYDTRRCRTSVPSNYLESRGRIIRVNRCTVTVRTVSGQVARVPKRNITTPDQ